MQVFVEYFASFCLDRLMTKLILLLFIGFFLADCMHISQKISYLPKRITKTETLTRIGRPFQIYRKNNLDHWVYKFRINNREYTKMVMFRGGKIIRTGKLKRYPSPEKLLRDSENFNDYKEAVKRIKSKK